MAKIGFIYVIRNDEHVSDRFKVGQTYDVEKRLRELNSETSNVGEFKLVAKFPVEDAEVAERKCHKALEEFKKAKEFFDAPRDKIVARVRYISEKFTPKAYMPEDIEAGESDEKIVEALLDREKSSSPIPLKGRFYYGEDPPELAGIDPSDTKALGEAIDKLGQKKSTKVMFDFSHPEKKEDN